jgi:hypothetical protein
MPNADVPGSVHGALLPDGRLEACHRASPAAVDADDDTSLVGMERS